MALANERRKEMRRQQEKMEGAREGKRQKLERKGKSKTSGIKGKNTIKRQEKLRDRQAK